MHHTRDLRARLPAHVRLQVSKRFMTVVRNRGGQLGVRRAVPSCSLGALEVSQVIPFEGRSRSLEPRPPRQARYLVVHLFAFALERCGYVDSEPAVLCTFRRNALRVIAMMSAARHSGVRLGMSVSAARALCPELVVEMWCEGEEEADWNSLGNILYQYTDRIQRGWDTDVVLEVSQSSLIW